MTNIFLLAALAVAAFIATNIDDLVLLAVLFAHPAWHSRSIVLGQLAGMAGLIAISAAIARLAATIPAGWIALLGFIPLAIGIGQLVALIRGKPSEGDEVPAQVRYGHRQTLAIAGITLANGGDNLGVYVPLFAQNFRDIGGYAVVFMAMTFVWLWLAHGAVRHPLIGQRIQRHGRVISPLVLIALGAAILKDAWV